MVALGLNGAALSNERFRIQIYPILKTPWGMLTTIRRGVVSGPNSEQRACLRARVLGCVGGAGWNSFGKNKGLSSDTLLNPFVLGGPSATRTRDQLVKSQLLYQLS